MRRIAAVLLPGALWAHSIDSIEHLSGATNQEVVMSNGRLAAGFSRRGELVVLRWPNPTYYEHMHYRTSNAKDARDLPYFGADPNDGSYAGLSIDGGPVTWLRDAPWQVGGYAANNTQPVVFVYRNDELGATVTEMSVVDPDLDVLLRRYEIAWDGPAPAARLHYFAHLSPSALHGEFAFGADEYTEDAAREHEATCGADALVDAADGGGVFVVVGGAMLAGFDACSVAEDQSADLSRDLAGSDVLTVAIAIAATPDDALAQARESAADFEAVLAAATVADSEWLARANLPATDDQDRLRVAMRALMAIRSAYDPVSGAIVASISSQPPYHLDWPRDGAFFNLALDVAGFPEMVERRATFYRSVQRRQDGDFALPGAPPEFAPAGSFAMNYYSDGAVGGLISFEIDQTGLVLWSWYEHAKWIDDDLARAEYLELVWPSIERAADLLTACKDEETGLQCEANEDDNPALTQTLHGATTVWLGLASAVKAGQYLGRDVAAWEARRDELGAAIDDLLYVDGEGYTPAGTDYNGNYGAPAWHIFPTRFRPYEDERMATTAAAVAELVRPFFERETEGGAYHAKALLALAVFAQETGDNALLSEVRDWIDVLVKEVANGFGHFGEVYLDLDSDGDGRNDTFDNRVAIPHVWEGALVYLALMAAYGGADAVVRADPMPGGAEGEQEPKTGYGDDGCGCAIGARR